MLENPSNPSSPTNPAENDPQAQTPPTEVNPPDHYPGDPAGMAMPTTTLPNPSEGTTTTDVRHAAQEALRRFQLNHPEKSPAADAAPIESTPTYVEGEVNLRIEIEGAPTPVIVQVKDEVIIGRRDPTANIAPAVDLTAHGGYQMGISRHHARLNIQDQRLILTDLGSRNGTYLNGTKLESQSSSPINNGDEIRLGKIVMRVYLQTKE